MSILKNKKGFSLIELTMVLALNNGTSTSKYFFIHEISGF